MHNELDDGLAAHARAKKAAHRKVPDSEPNKYSAFLTELDASAKGLTASITRRMHNVRSAQLQDAQMKADLALSEAVVAHVEAFGCSGPQETKEHVGWFGFGSRVVAHCCNKDVELSPEAHAMMIRHGRSPIIVTQPGRLI